MDSCQKCKHAAQIKYLDNQLCNSCFTRLVERRISKYLRLHSSIKKNDSLLVVGELCHSILKDILKDLPVKINIIPEADEYHKNSAIKIKAKKLKAKIVIPWTMDHESHHFIKNFIEKKKPTFLGINKPFIKLFYPITDQEAQILAKIKNVKYKPLKEDSYTKMFVMLENKYVSVRYAFASSVKEFSRIFK
ncbi:hypothetical protein J4418_05180 [Candidatus Woesearchaeota archaeon]|nr:hypothetical protein [Candidatus Woesearchaeota archaeon]